jgi:large subunit ribosomal protein L3
MLLGRKLGMTQVFEGDGAAIPVTAIEAGPCVVLAKKAPEKNGGHCAIQLGFEPVKDKHAPKPQRGHAAKAGVGHAFRFARDMRVELLDGYELGQEITVAQFEAGQTVDVIGTSKGKGFQGVIKRYGHRGGPSSHGSNFHRAPGSIGASASPSRVLKRTKMPGHMGHQQVTIQKLKVVAVYPEQNLLLLRGAVPGPTQALVTIRPTVKQKRAKTRGQQ